MKGLLVLFSTLLVLLMIAPQESTASLTALEAHQKQQFCANKCTGAIGRAKGNVKALAMERRRCRIECVKRDQPPMEAIVRGAKPVVRKVKRRFH